MTKKNRKCFLESLHQHALTSDPRRRLAARGWHDIRVGNIRLSFRDFRSNSIDGSYDNTEEHYSENTRNNLRALAEEEFLGQRGPDLLLTEAFTGFVAYHKNPDLVREHFDWVLDAIGPDFQGQILYGQGFFNPQAHFNTNRKVQDVLNAMNTPNNAHTYDFQQMSSSAVHAMELPIHDTVTTVHHNRKCTDEGHVHSRVCGPTVEMTAHIVFNLAAGIRRQGSIEQDSWPLSEVRICENCPETFAFINSPKASDSKCAEHHFDSVQANIGYST